MTRILSYNIRTGDYNYRSESKRRTKELCAMIRSLQPDVVGLVEPFHPKAMQKPLVIEEIAEQLDMKLIQMDCSQKSHRHAALLTRLPVINVQFHSFPLMTPLLEACLEEANGQTLTVFVTHLRSGFNQRRAGDDFRQQEVREVLRVMQAKQGTPHLLMGDFNSLAPGDRFRVSALLSYIVQLDRMRQAHIDPVDNDLDFNFVVPPHLRILNPLLRRIPQNRLLSRLFDATATLYAPRGCVRLLLQAGYQDCFRLMNPGVQAFTCPSPAPAGRIDYIFASPELARRLSSSSILTGADGVSGDEASDHLPVFAEFNMG